MNLPEQWGPPLWKLFHMFAEQAGKQTEISLQRKELSLWEALIHDTKNIIGCDACRLHVNHYLQSHPFMEPSYPSLKIYMRDFFYEFHEYVNQQTLKPSFDRSLLPTIYTTLDEFELSFNQFTAQMELLLHSKKVTQENYQQWLDHFHQLRNLCSIPNINSV